MSKILKPLIVAALIGASVSVPAQSALDLQIEAVRRAQEERKAQEAAAQADLERRAREDYERRLAQEALDREAAREIEAKRIEAQRERDRAERARQAALAAKQAELEARERAFEDQKRTLELESEKVDLDVKKARATRTHDFVDQELKRMEATTDVVQSGADAARNVSEGVKNKLSAESDANKKKGFFEVWFSDEQSDESPE
jgi:hypothetical protein